MMKSVCFNEYIKLRSIKSLIIISFNLLTFRLGEVDIPLFSLVNGVPKNEWYQLSPAKGGAVHLIITAQGFGTGAPGGAMGVPYAQAGGAYMQPGMQPGMMQPGMQPMMQPGMMQPGMMPMQPGMAYPQAAPYGAPMMGMPPAGYPQPGYPGYY